MCPRRTVGALVSYSPSFGLGDGVSLARTVKARSVVSRSPPRPVVLVHGPRRWSNVSRGVGSQSQKIV